MRVEVGGEVGTMESRIIGRIELDEESVRREVGLILSSHPDPGYTGYSFGTWNIYLLWNASGEVNDSTLREFEGPARITDLGRRLPYLSSLIECHFRTDRMKWVRAFLLRDGSIVPHRDYLEFKKPLTRIHLALLTDETSLHSEDEDVFQMRAGEVWYLAAGKVHSAASLSDFSRVVLCMEFDLDEGEGPEAAFRTPMAVAPEIAPRIVDRQPPSEEELAAIYGLGALVNESNYRDIVQLLSKVHFYKRAHAGAVYDWLLEIARRSGNQALVERTDAYKRNCIESRQMNEEIAIR
jgi:putative nonproteinogenic amino acid hydroxylase